MNRKLFITIGAISALALASACVIEETSSSSSNTGGAGGTGGAGVGGSGATGGSGGAGVGGGTGGSGGEAACQKCAEWVTSDAGPDALCGYDAVNDECEVGTSCEIALDREICICSDASKMETAECETICADPENATDEDIEACLIGTSAGACTAEFTACNNDA